MATFSVTDIGTFRRCRRKWDYSSNARRNLSRVGSGPEALELGGLIHRALADWILEPDPKKVRLAEIFVKHSSQREEEITKAFEERTGLPIQDVQLESLYNVVMLGVAMMNNYQDFHKTPLPHNMKFAMPEQEVLVKVPNTEHQCQTCYGKYVHNGHRPPQIYDDESVFVKFSDCTECGGTGVSYHYMSMTLDGLLIDKKDRLWVLEHKTYSQRPQLIDLYMNDQFTKYTWGVNQLDLGWVQGIAYDGMAKKEKPTYMVEDGIRRKQTLDDLFLRKTIEKTPEELAEAGRIIALEINEMANDPEIYPNVQWQGCRTEKCPFIDVCRMQMMGESHEGLLNAQFTQRVVVRGGRAYDQE